MQQVNLYLKEFQPEKTWLTLTSLLLAVALLFLFFGGNGAYKNSQAKKLSSDASSKEKILEKMQRELSLLKKSSSSEEKDKLERQIEKKRKEIRVKERIITAFSDQELGNDKGFSAFMLGLARESSPKISLSQIRLSNGGKLLEFKGESKNSEAVPEYIDRLIDDTYFSESKFGSIYIGKNDEGKITFLSGFSEEAPSQLDPSQLAAPGLGITEVAK